ncbi:MAG: glutamate-5-semialdehyde dehydrogenase [Clostridiales bacterium]|nr:glutamate-5-semialdehyde dehydrogenase [Clostridiales bacterium]
MARASAATKNRALLALARLLRENTEALQEDNALDLAPAQANGLSAPMVDRLRLSPKVLETCAQGCEQLAAMPDVIGEILGMKQQPSGIRVGQMRVPIGVFGMVYESRPNVTIEAASLSIKSGNACILRGGKEAFHSASAIAAALQEGLISVGLPGELVQLVQDTTRNSATELMQGVGFIDLLIPRGGAGLIRACTENAKVPCIQTGTGICHIYVDRAADLDMAVSIIENAKTSRPSVCNAAEVCIVHRDIAADFLPMLQQILVTKREADGKIPVEFRADAEAAKYIGVPAGEQDFDTEFLDYIMAVRIVASVEEAIAHIAAHSTGHSEAIITADDKAAERFIRMVDSAAVYVNASTRFTDGGEFGLGCEMGISTQKLHARGPMGLRELTAYKYIVRGNGQIR